MQYDSPWENKNLLHLTHQFKFKHNNKVMKETQYIFYHLPRRVRTCSHYLTGNEGRDLIVFSKLKIDPPGHVEAALAQIVKHTWETMPRLVITTLWSVTWFKRHVYYKRPAMMYNLETGELSKRPEDDL